MNKNAAKILNIQHSGIMNTIAISEHTNGRPVLK